MKEGERERDWVRKKEGERERESGLERKKVRERERMREVVGWDVIQS